MKDSVKVLIVDDDEDVRSLMIDSVSTIEGTTVFSAVDGEDGKQIFLKEKPDILVTDVRMPKLDGVQMVKALFEVKALKRPRFIVMISGFESEEARTKAQLTGIFFLEKPFAEEKLIAIVDDMAAALKRERLAESL